MPKPKRRGGTSSASEFGEIRSFLARAGVSQAQIREVIGAGTRGRSRGEIAQLLRKWMRGLPRA